ncbi:MAG: MBL fold metallo-hydrolase [Nitrospinae bacterium]|nr:MBL fold metallo-hydrolase [Nitrospinota bacterium]
MADRSKSLNANVTGEFFVDATCINSGACRAVAPAVFAERHGRSYVQRQPTNDEERALALMASAACPAGSIGPSAEEAGAPAVELFPQKIADNVYYNGYNSPLSFGASSYLIRRPEGNVLIDAPRFEPDLVRRLEQMGGVALMFLTHRDDVGEHERFAAHFGCKRIMHRSDLHRGLTAVEVTVEGVEPVRLAGDLLVIPVPGHTKGSICLLHGAFLFTGDHLAQNPNRTHPTAFNNHCWYSRQEQTASMKRLAAYDFEWILPGHGGRAHYPLGEMKQKMAECIAWMESVQART